MKSEEGIPPQSVNQYVVGVRCQVSTVVDLIQEREYICQKRDAAALLHYFELSEFYDNVLILLDKTPLLLLEASES